ncbi:MAG TPA: PSD1 and planctomycete cytochrome C domain-containing protein, partial [Verrucomicrobiae bacterium]|nr:PSD1 and planctomycete cytochrome C domain-containing protein [Verrucomicrobiae bacterium]
MAALIAVFGTAATVRAASIDHSDGFEFFENKIRPLLVERCFECHSTSSKKIKGGLTLDSRDQLLKGGDSGPAIVPGAPEKSLLIKAVRYGNKDLQMPPKHQLAATEITLLEQWVKMGAPDPRTNTASMQAVKAASTHWAFQPVSDPCIPTVRNARWPSRPIDNFILAKLEANGLRPNFAADRRTLLRRVTFDLTGLPPTPEEVTAFINDSSPDAFERVIDRLLASPQYGERWGRYWLDLARYADTAGDSADYPIPQAYKYRNYVIDAFNADKPYDEFIREQIAGDLLPAKSPEDRRQKIIATGYIALARRFSVDPQSAHHLTLEDTIDTMGKSLLGLSLSCARCHDHKYDPIPTQDYYGLYGIFNSTRYPFAGSETKKRPADLVPLIPAAELEILAKPFQDRLKAIDEEISRLEGERETLAQEMLSTREARERLAAANETRDDLIATAPVLDVAFAVSEGKADNARVQRRGEPGSLGEEVPRHFLQCLGGQSLPKTETGSGRLELAQWLTSPTNPLTARVIVNRVWQHHFGKGLVQTPSDFGARGRPPTHPELLDYLAQRLVQSGWSIKA